MQAKIKYVKEAFYVATICPYCGATTCGAVTKNQFVRTCRVCRKEYAASFSNNKIDLHELEKRLDDALDKETRETLTEWMKDVRRKHRKPRPPQKFKINLESVL